MRVVEILKQPDGSRMAAQGVSPLAFEDVAAIYEQAAVEAPPIGHFGLGGAGISPRPVARVQLVYPAPGVAARIRRIVPRAVVHRRPRHELRARIVRVGIVIAEVGEWAAACRDG